MRRSMQTEKMPGGLVERTYFFEGRIATRTSTKVKGAFIVSANRVQVRRIHRPGPAESLWVAGQYMGLTAKTACGHWLAMVNVFDEAPEQYELCDVCLIGDFPGPCVYRLFDKDDNLLYIGCSIKLFGRLMSHVGPSSWRLGELVARWEYEVYPDHEAALHAEKLAILAENPPVNSDMTDRSPNRGRRRAAFAHLIPDKALAPP